MAEPREEARSPDWVEPELGEDDDPGRALGRVLDLVDSVAVAPERRRGLVGARVLAVSSDGVEVEAWEGGTSFHARLAPFVDARLLGEESAQGRLALVDVGPRGATLIGFLQTEPLVATSLRGRDVEIEASNELVLRSGRAALRLRADGSVELIGTRISAVSRGVLRLLGRALRLN